VGGSCGAGDLRERAEGRERTEREMAKGSERQRREKEESRTPRGRELSVTDLGAELPATSAPSLQPRLPRATISASLFTVPRCVTSAP
jgi:hypothetical protein